MLKQRAALKELKRRHGYATCKHGYGGISYPDAPPSRPKKKRQKGGDTKKVPVISIGVKG